MKKSIHSVQTKNSKFYVTHFLIIVFFGVIFTEGCKHEILPPDVISPPNDNGWNPTDTVLFGNDPCDPDSVYFQNEILPLFVSSCAQPGCHDAGTAEDGVLLNNYFNIINTGEVSAFDPNDSEIYETITDDDPEDRMPPAGEDQLTSEQINLIYQWISQGAQNNSCSACDTNAVTFSQTIYPLVELKCQGCHSGNDPSGSLTLNNYSDISLIAISGAFYSSLIGTDNYTQMPYNSNPLPQCEIDLILSWIEDGAPNN